MKYIMQTEVYREYNVVHDTLVWIGTVHVVHAEAIILWQFLNACRVFHCDGSSYWSITTDGGQRCMHVCCHYSSVEQPQGVLNSRDLWIWNRFNSVRPGGICTSPLPTQLQEGNPQQSGHFRCYLSSTSKGFHLVLTSVSMMPSSF